MCSATQLGSFPNLQRLPGYPLLPMLRQVTMWHLYMRLNINIRSAVCFQLKIASRIYTMIYHQMGNFFQIQELDTRNKEAWYCSTCRIASCRKQCANYGQFLLKGFSKLKTRIIIDPWLNKSYDSWKKITSR